MSRNNIISTEDGKVFYVKSKGAVVTTNAPGTRPTGGISKDINSSGEVKFWGSNNLFPQEVSKAIKESNIVFPGIDWKVRALYGSGLVTGYTVIGDKGQEVFKYKRYPEFEEFAKRSNIKLYLRESIMSFYSFYNLYPELILTGDRSEIYSLQCLNTTYCRWQKPGDDGRLKYLYHNPNWDNGGNAGNSTKIPVIDPYVNPIGQLKAQSGFKYVYPVSYPDPDSDLYQLAPWHSILSTGWLDVAKAIPQFKKKLFENQLSIKYHIEIATWYWEWKYKGFEQKPQKERIKLMEDEIDKFMEVMSGTDGAGKAFISSSKYDEYSRDNKSAWKINAIDERIKDGTYIEDSQEASLHIFSALGIDPTIFGIIPGKTLSAGSGSDKRVAFNNYISLCEMHKDVILEPLYFIRDYNGWPSDMEFRFRYPLIMTLDKGKEVQQETK